MANQEHVDILKQGVEVWNRWREENPDIIPDLNGAHLNRINLEGANLWRVSFWRAHLRGAHLEGACLEEARLEEVFLNGANLVRTNLKKTNLKKTNLFKAHLNGAYLNGAFLEGAYLKEAYLNGAFLNGAILEDAILEDAILEDANLEDANLEGANLEGANLEGANLEKTDLEGAILEGTRLIRTILANLDLSKAKGLKNCHHLRSSTLGTNTLVRSKGQIPNEFLRGCGLSDWEMESAKLYDPNLNNEEIIDINYKIIDIRSTQAIQINPLFISYTHSDCAFVDKIEQELIAKGVRFWRDTHHATAGKLEKQIDKAMRLNDIVLLVLSKDSVNSDWVEHEAKKARKLEKELKKDVLCPVALDDSWKKCDWPEVLRDQIEKYNILDFSEWQNPDSFQRMFAKLLNGLDLFYKD